MDSINKLTQMFGHFPGIGPRQAKRFVYFLLSESFAYTKELTELMVKIKRDIGRCPTCFKFSVEQGGKNGCEICLDQTRDNSTLMVVAKDIDMENINRSGEFKGRYFILGGLLPILEKAPEQKIRIRELEAQVKKMADKNLREIIIALSANPEGDNTADYVKNTLAPICENVRSESSHIIKISVLGRGLSTGTELEYSDSDTIKNALKNRQ